MTNQIKSNQGLNNYAEKVMGGTDEVLGLLVWYSVADVRVDPKTVESLAKKFGLKAPKQKAAADAFRVATSKYQHRDESGKYRYLMRPVIDSPTVIIRDLIRETVDEMGQALDHEAVGRIRLDRGQKGDPDKVSIQKITDPVATPLLEKARAEFDSLKDNLSGKDITRWVLKRLKEMSTLTVHPNGRVYFIPSYNSERVNAIKGFLNGLKPYKVSSHPMTFGVAPLPNTPDEREMVVEGFKDEAGSRVNEVIAEITETLQGAGEDGLAPRVVTTRLNRIREAQEFVDGYKAFLGETMPLLDERLEMMQEQAEALQDALREDEGEG